MKLPSQKLIAVILVLALMAALAACAGPTTTSTTTVTETTTTATSTETEPVEKALVRIGALKGPTGMGLVGLMDSFDQGNTMLDYEFNITGSPDDMVAMISSGQVDIAALPTNLASVLYNKTGGSLQVIALNTLGVLYILENGNAIDSIQDLAGKTILATGQGAVPEYALNQLLADAGIADSVTVEYKTEHSELATLAVSGQADIVMLPEPFVTTVLSKNADMRLALDLTAEWEEIQTAAGSDSQLAMGCLVVNKAYAENHIGEIVMFLGEYMESVNFVNDNPEAAGDLIAQYEILPDAALAAAAIPNSHMVMIEGMEMKSILSSFLDVLYEANPASVGGELPDDMFYFMP